MNSIYPQKVIAMKSLILPLVLAAALHSVSAQAATPSLINDGFEAGWTSYGLVGSDGHVTFVYRPAGPDIGWTFLGGGGVAGNYDALTAYEGQRFGLLQLGNPADLFGASGASFTQSFSLDVASTVDLSFALALRPGYRAGQQVAVALDGQVVHTFATASGWHVQNLALGDLSAGTHVLGFAGTASYAVYGDTTAYIDAVHLNATPVSPPVPEPDGWALMLAGLGVTGLIARRRLSV